MNGLLPETSDEIREYLNDLCDGERVVDTGQSANQGRSGTVYTAQNGGKCVLWDMFEGEAGQMGTSVTGGARRIDDIEIEMYDKFKEGYTQLLRDLFVDLPVENQKKMTAEFEEMIPTIHKDTESFLRYPARALSGKEADDIVEQINREIDMEFEQKASCGDSLTHEPVVGGMNDDGYIICRHCGNFIQYSPVYGYIKQDDPTQLDDC